MELKDFNINEEDVRNYLNEMRERDGIQESRFLKFEKYLESNDFDKLIYRIILEHDENWRDSCYEKGHEPHPNNKLTFILNYIEDRGNIVKVDEIDSEYPNEIFEFKGYYFQDIYGQGVITKIYNKKDLKLLLVI